MRSLFLNDKKKNQNKKKHFALKTTKKRAVLRKPEKRISKNLITHHIDGSHLQKAPFYPLLRKFEAALKTHRLFKKRRPQTLRILQITSLTFKKPARRHTTLTRRKEFKAKYVLKTLCTRRLIQDTACQATEHTTP